MTSWNALLFVYVVGIFEVRRCEWSFIFGTSFVFSVGGGRFLITKKTREEKEKETQPAARK